MSDLMTETQRSQKSTLQDWRRRVKWKLHAYVLEVPRSKNSDVKVPPRTVNVLAPFPEDAVIGAGATRDKQIRTTTPGSSLISSRPWEVRSKAELRKVKHSAWERCRADVQECAASLVDCMRW